MEGSDHTVLAPSGQAPAQAPSECAVRGWPGRYRGVIFAIAGQHLGQQIDSCVERVRHLAATQLAPMRRVAGWWQPFRHEEPHGQCEEGPAAGADGDRSRAGGACCVSRCCLPSVGMSCHSPRSRWLTDANLQLFLFYVQICSTEFEGYDDDETVRVSVPGDVQTAGRTCLQAFGARAFAACLRTQCPTLKALAVS